MEEDSAAKRWRHWRYGQQLEGNVCCERFGNGVTLKVGNEKLITMGVEVLKLYGLEVISKT